MRTYNNQPFSNSGFFALQNDDWLQNQRIAGKIASSILSHIESLIANKTNLSMIELDNIAEKMILDSNATPTFKGIKNFPGTMCISINNQLVHGIPTDYKLQDGDVVSFDIGVTYNKTIADTAITCIYGSPKSPMHVKLIEATKSALYKAIKSIKVDKKYGCIGNAIYKSAKGDGFNVITKYGGHSISSDKFGNEILHASPFISNKSELNEGFRIQKGLILCIEPMLGIGDTNTWIDKDGWTVCTKDVFAHAEHTVYIHENNVEVITLRKDEVI
jgi:methionyl aminopeptidase